MQLSPRMKNIAGNVYGSLTAVRPLRLSRHGSVVWEYSCICGNTHAATATQISSVCKASSNSTVPSCGCVRDSVAKALSTTHGYARHPLNAVWQSMLQRCNNPNHPLYRIYGGRGITVCAEWQENPKAFIEWALQNGWAKGLHLDKDTKSDATGQARCYSPETCVFLSATENVRYSSSRENFKRNSSIKILPQDLLHLRAMYATGEHSQRGLARIFGITQAHVWRLLHPTN